MKDYSIKTRSKMSKNLNDIFFNNKSDNFFLLAGPCVIESESVVLRLAEKIKIITDKLNIPYIFKASYIKANRSSIDSFTGLGEEEGLRILEKVKNEFDLKIVTDIHTPDEARPVAEVVDILQIPAFLCRQTDLLISAAETGKIVNVKKGQFLSPQEMGNVISKIESSGNEKIMLTERGTFFGYNNLVVDFRGFMEMSEYGYPVIYDVTHSLQRPAALGNVSGGQPEYVKQMAKAAMATGVVNGFFIETHDDLKNAKSDAKAMLPLDQLESVLVDLLRIQDAI